MCHYQVYSIKPGRDAENCSTCQIQPVKYIYNPKPNWCLVINPVQFFQVSYIYHEDKLLFLCILVLLKHFIVYSV